MKMDTRPGVSVGVRASAKSFLSAFLSILFVIPTGVSWPATVEGAACGAEGGHGSAPVPVREDDKTDAAVKGLPITELSADEAILHALNRFAYGPRPGDVERVRQTGLAKWIEQQLNPNSIDDKAMKARLQDYPTLRMPTAKLIDEYPQPKPAEKQAEKQIQAQAQEQRRSEAASETVARDMQGAQG